MASVKRHGEKWRAQVARQGVRKTKVFASKREALDWSARFERMILDGDKIAAQGRVSDLFDRYRAEVSPRKRGEHSEALRLNRMSKDPIGRKKLGDLSQKDIAAWRDNRLLEVSPGTVKREMNLMSAVFSHARDEWGVIGKSPMQGVKQPPSPPARDRLPTDHEIEAMRHVAGADLTKARARVFQAFLFAGETAMRSGEIVGLTWDRLDLGARVAHLPETKNGTARSVPLSTAAIDLIEALPRADPVFGLEDRQRDALFRSMRDKAGVEGLTFHDSRAWATGKLSKKVDVLTLARITGHKDIKMLMVYYRETAADIAKRLG